MEPTVGGKGADSSGSSSINALVRVAALSEAHVSGHLAIARSAAYRSRRGFPLIEKLFELQ
jgi:hypothetical protein